MLEHLDDVVDDLSVFHEGVTYDNALELPSSRFFRMAQRLRFRGGAVAASLAGAQVVEREEVSVPALASLPPSGPTIAAGTADDIAAIAAMSQNPGFPGIGYSGG